MFNIRNAPYFKGLNVPDIGIRSSKTADGGTRHQLGMKSTFEEKYPKKVLFRGPLSHSKYGVSAVPKGDSANGAQEQPQENKKENYSLCSNLDIDNPDHKDFIIKMIEVVDTLMENEISKKCGKYKRKDNRGTFGPLIHGNDNDGEFHHDVLNYLKGTHRFYARLVDFPENKEKGFKAKKTMFIEYVPSESNPDVPVAKELSWEDVMNHCFDFIPFYELSYVNIGIGKVDKIMTNVPYVIVKNRRKIVKSDDAAAFDDLMAEENNGFLKDMITTNQSPLVVDNSDSDKDGDNDGSNSGGLPSSVSDYYK